MENKLLYSRKEAAAVLSVSLRTLDYLVATRQLVTRKIGARVLIPSRELQKFAEGYRVSFHSAK